MNEAVERTALKEWAVLVDAMARGDVVAMVRKGGIREQRAGFSVHHDRFLLYPTYFHEKAAELAPRLLPMLESSHAERPREGRIHLAYLATVAAVWTVSDLDVLRAIGEEHGLAWGAVESRFRYKGKLGVQVVAVRIACLAHAVELPEITRYGGCVSWLELDTDVAVQEAIPVVPDAVFDRRLAILHHALGTPTTGTLPGTPHVPSEWTQYPSNKKGATAVAPSVPAR